MSLYLNYLLLITLLVSILPTGKWIQKFDRELSRKWSHLLVGVILWSGSLLFDNLIHQLIVAIIYTIVVTILEYMDLVPDQRDDASLDNKKAALLYGLGQCILALLLLIDPKYILHYGLATFTLAFGDAFAALVGIRYGKYSIKLPHNKSLIGTIAFIVAAIIGMLIPCTILGYGLSLITQLIILAIVGSIVEIYAGDNDNLLIQVIVGFAALILI